MENQDKAGQVDKFFVRTKKANKSVKKDNVEKKPFNKRKWREEKYSLKNKVDKWKENRKRAILRNYVKEGTSAYVEKVYKEENVEEEEQDEQMTKEFKKPHQRFQDKRQEIMEKRENAAQARVAREVARKEAQQKRMEKHRKLNRKTKKGQPVMKGQIEYLLEKIQKNRDIY